MPFRGDVTRETNGIDRTRTAVLMSWFNPLNENDGAWPTAQGWVIKVASSALRSNQRHWFVLGRFNERNDRDDSMTTSLSSARSTTSTTAEYEHYMLRYYESERAAAARPRAPLGAISLHWQHVDIHADEGGREVFGAVSRPARAIPPPARSRVSVRHVGVEPPICAAPTL